MTLTASAHAPHPIAAPPLPLFRSSEISHAERAIAAGELVRVRRGVLAPASLWWSLPPWRRYAGRVHAVALAHPGVVFCGESAAAIRGLPVFGDPLEIQILDLPEATARLAGGIRRHTTTDLRIVERVGGVFVTSLTDTVIDIARSRHRAVGLAVADAALRAQPDLTVEQLVAENERRRSSRGRRIARWSLHRATPLAETVLESVSRAAIEWLGFECPALQVEFSTDGFRDRVDMWWEHARIVGEADGELKYDGSLQPAADAIRREKERDRRLRRHASDVVHWGWRDLVQADPLGDALRRAGLRPVQAESSLDLHGLASALRTAPGREAAPARRD